MFFLLGLFWKRSGMMTKVKLCCCCCVSETLCHVKKKTSDSSADRRFKMSGGLHDAVEQDKAKSQKQHSDNLHVLSVLPAADRTAM